MTKNEHFPYFLIRAGYVFTFSYSSYVKPDDHQTDLFSYQPAVKLIGRRVTVAAGYFSMKLMTGSQTYLLAR